MRFTAKYLNAVITGVGGGGGASGGGVGFSQWIPHDYWQTPVNVGLAAVFGSGSTANVTVQFTMDDLGSNARRLPQAISQTTTVITVTDLGDPNATFPGSPGAQIATHGLSVGDYVRLDGTQIGVDGDYNIATIVSATQYTLTSSISQTAVGASGSSLLAARVFPHTVLAAITARAVSNYAFPVRGSRLIYNSGAGIAGLLVWQGGMST